MKKSNHFLSSTNMHHHEGQFLGMIIVSFSEKSLDWNFWLDSLLESISWSDCNFQNWLHPIRRSSYPLDSAHQPKKAVENFEIFWNFLKFTLPRSILQAIGSADKSEIELFEKSSCVTPFMNRFVPSRLFRVINSVSKMSISKLILNSF